MAILTDGQAWNFFLPTEQGNYSARQFYKLDIQERDPQEAESSFKRYLDYYASHRMTDDRHVRPREEGRLDTRDGVRANDLANGGPSKDFCKTDSKERKVSC